VLGLPIYSHNSLTALWSILAGIMFTIGICIAPGSPNISTVSVWASVCGPSLNRFKADMAERRVNSRKICLTNY